MSNYVFGIILFSDAFSIYKMLLLQRERMQRLIKMNYGVQNMFSHYQVKIRHWKILAPPVFLSRFYSSVHGFSRNNPTVLYQLKIVYLGQWHINSIQSTIRISQNYFRVPSTFHCLVTFSLISCTAWRTCLVHR